MLIDIRTISRSTGASMAIETEISPEELDVSSLGYRLTRPLSFRGEVQNAGDGILSLTGQIETGYEGDCARCLVPVAQELSGPIAESFQSSRTEAEETDDLAYRYSGGYLDVGQAIRDNLLPALPVRMICREDCLGLCPDCGTNLNDKECGCAAGRKGKASPFDQLKELL